MYVHNRNRLTDMGSKLWLPKGRGYNVVSSAHSGSNWGDQICTSLRCLPNADNTHNALYHDWDPYFQKCDYGIQPFQLPHER